MPHPSIALALIAGCVPVLTSPEDSSADAGWQAPENAWPTSAPPEDLEGEGWQEGQVAPDARMVDQNGQEVSLWQFYGSVVVIDVSTMWCSPCQKLAAEICAVRTDYLDQGFEYLTVLSQNKIGEQPSDEDLDTWTSDYDICAPVLRDDADLERELVPDGAFPSLTVLDRDMVVVERRVEPAEDAVLRALVESLL